MYSRVLREGLFDSDRWLGLPTDTHRLAFIGLISRADDFGNLEGSNRMMFRFMHQFTQVKSEVDTVKLLSDLCDVDLIRRYEIDGKVHYHLPRFKNSRSRFTRICPPSPWCDAGAPTGRRHAYQGVSEKGESQVNHPSITGAAEVMPGDGDGDGDGVKKAVGTRFALALLPDDWKGACKKLRPDLNPATTFERFSDYWTAQPGAKGRKTDWLATWRNWCRNEKTARVADNGDLGMFT